MEGFPILATASAILMILAGVFTRDRLFSRALVSVGVGGLVMRIPRLLGLEANLWTLLLVLLGATVTAVPLYQLWRRERSRRSETRISRPK